MSGAESMMPGAAKARKREAGRSVTVDGDAIRKVADAVDRHGLEVVRDAVKVVKAGAARRAAASGPGQPQTDLEEFTGNPGQEEREAEVGGIAVDRLRSIIERVERLEEEKKALSGDIKDIFAEAKSAGFDVKVVRALLVLRRKEPAEVEEQETLLDLYRRALGD